ncbi:hypothetical protein [Streptomyces diastatochromogenes]|uniref:hypothetical protein n=1 Tax=Streptomyces diastatochromogenes TaxID=42236 RepID=UPI00142D566E|nr:hypothetical protein [Streptomyces diastatochromogenes]MCZ0984616.1 hypothetical protein [Streptomyces diastatochromogenes]
MLSRKGSPNIKGPGRLRYVVEQTIALLHQFKRLVVRWERRIELHDSFLSLACSLICWRRLKKTGSWSPYELIRNELSEAAPRCYFRGGP